MPTETQIHHDPEAIIVLRIARERKGRYVAASRSAGLTLAAWCLAHLDRAAGLTDPPASQPPAPAADP
jgi:hypothetical protein